MWWKNLWKYDITKCNNLQNFKTVDDREFSYKNIFYFNLYVLRFDKNNKVISILRLEAAPVTNGSYFKNIFFWIF